MNNKICFVLLVSLLAPACVRKKTATTHKTSQKAQAYDENLPKTTYDENVGAFVLEDDAGHDIFSEAKDVKKSGAEPDKTSGITEKTDLDDAWAWQELDEEQPTQIIHFDYDSVQIRPDQELAIKYDAQQAKSAVKDGATVVVEGHACLITRSQSYNQALSQKRADVVKKRLVQAGVAAKSIKAVGRGISCLISQAEGKEGQSPNRRAEVKFIYPRDGQMTKKKAPAQTVKHTKAVKHTHKKKSNKVN